MTLLKNKLFILFTLLINVQFLFSQEILKGKKVFEAFFGTNPENVTFKKHDFVPGGPTDFWSENDEYFYILDAMSHRIKKFKKTGNLIWEISLEYYPIYIWMLNDSSYVSLNAQMSPASEIFNVTKFNKDGLIISNSKKLNWPNYSNNLHLKCSNDKIYVQTEKYAHILDYHLNVIDTLKRFERNCYYLTYDYLYVFKVHNFQPKPEITISKPVVYSKSIKTNQISFKANIAQKNNRSALFRPLGTDASGNFFISRLDNPKKSYRVMKYNSEGNLISENKIYIHSYAHGPFNFKIMSSGDIYTQNSDRKRYWIEKYPAKWFEE